MNPELIQRFFLKRCTPEEAKHVAGYLKENPSVLEEYLSSDEWNSLAVNENLPQEFWDEVWQNIQQRNKTKVFAIRLKRFAAAASVVLLAALVVYYMVPAKQVQQQIAKQIVVPETEHKTVANTSKKIIKFTLEDSSLVEISPASSIQFDVPFPSNKRTIVLEGEAKFHITKNKQKPFTVYAGALGTTALGTVFSVKKINTKNSVTVKLFEGKVVIHSTNKNLAGWKNDVYLTPGRQMKFDAVLKTVAVNNIADIKTIADLKPKPGMDSISNQLLFNNTALPEVMHQLSAYYHVNIAFDSLVIDTMNFTGTITNKDSLPVILKAIGQMNGLEISGTDKEFIVSKQHN